MIDEVVLRRIGRALIELHDDIRAQLLLDLHVRFGGPANLRAIVDRLEREPIFIELQRIGERKNLEPAAIGEDRTGIVHERMKPARLFDKIRTRPKRKMVRVRQDDLRADLMERLGANALYRCTCSNGHEQRRFHDAMRCFEAARTRVAARGFERVIEERHYEHSGKAVTKSSKSSSEPCFIAR